MILVDECRDLVRLFASHAESTWKKDVVDVFQTLKKIFRDASEMENPPELRLNNKLIDKFIVKPRGVREFFLRVAPYTQDHVVTEASNEQRFRLKPGAKDRLADLFSALETILGEEASKDPWWDELTVMIKVALPDGTALQGNFSPKETVENLKQWVQRRLVPPSSNPIVIGDQDITLDSQFDTMTLNLLDLNRKRLVV